MPTAPVCVIVLNYNAMDHTLACVNSLVKGSVVPDTIIICDNGSQERVPEILHAWAGRYGIPVSRVAEVSQSVAAGGPRIVLLENNANRGYAGGNNPGIRYALQQNRFKYIWILNNDTIVSHDALQSLLQCGEAQPDAGVFGSTVVHLVRPEIVQCAGGCIYNPLTTVFRPALAWLPLYQVLSIPENPRLDYVYGASMFVRATVFEKCGFLNEDYFLFYEEIDFCKRAQQAGYNLSWCRESIISHMGSATVGTPEAADKRKIAFANYHENLSTMIFTKKHYPWSLPAIMLFRFFGKLALLLKRRELYLIKPLFQAYSDFLLGNNKRENYKC